MRWQLTKCILNKQLHLLDICRDNYTYLLLTIITWICSDKSGMFEIMSDLASEERLFYYQLALIWQAVLTPFLQSGNHLVTSNFCCSYKWCRWDPATIIHNTPTVCLTCKEWNKCLGEENQLALKLTITLQKFTSTVMLAFKFQFFRGMVMLGLRRGWTGSIFHNTGFLHHPEMCFHKFDICYSACGIDEGLSRSIQSVLVWWFFTSIWEVWIAANETFHNF